MINEKLKLAFILKQICENFDKQKYRLITNSGEVFKSRYLFFYYFLINSETFDNKYISIVKDYFEKIEKDLPGSSYNLSKFIYKKLLNKKIKTDKKEVALTRDNIKKYFKQNSVNNNFNKILSVIDFIGPDGSIVCKESNNDNITCERKDKSIFKINSYENFNYIYFSNKSKINNNFFVTVCDTFIEKESYLIPAIEKASINKKNLIIFCRGITLQASDQIKQIMSRTKTIIYIYCDKFDQKDPFKFKDLSESLNIPIISPEKGSNILRDIAESTRLVNNLTISSEKIIFSNNKNLLVNKINSQIRSCNDDNLLEYLKFRKSRAISKIATVYVPKNNKVLIQDFKDTIYSFNIILKYGLSENNGELISNLCLNKSLTMSEKFYNTINNIGLVLKESN